MSASENEFEIVPRSVKTNMVLASGVDEVLTQIRPEWADRSLIQRVKKLLPVDPSSACQRIFNAAIHDLRNKIITAGLDIADEAATRYRLPSVKKPEDILDTYSVAHVIDLAYRMGILVRPEWRRLSRCYEIRRDLEHEDDEYEATIEDIVYIFKTCIEIILSQDAIELLRVSDVKEALDSPDRITPSVEMVKNFEKAPHPRQLQIVELLVNTALDSHKPDIARQNAMELLRRYQPITRNTVKVELANTLQARIAKKHIDLVTAKVAHTSGLLPYLKQRQVEEFFRGFMTRFKDTGHHWSAYSQHGQLFEDFEDVGGFRSCPESLRRDIVLWMTLCYLGEPGGYGMGANRPVFYSNSAAPRIERLFKAQGKLIAGDLQAIRADRRVEAALGNKYIARRFEELVDFVTPEKSPAEPA